MSTTLGSAVAVAAVALISKMSWGLRIGLIVLVLVVAVGYELWTRRAQIAQEIAAQQHADQPAPGSEAPPSTPTAGPPAGPTP